MLRIELHPILEVRWRPAEPSGVPRDRRKILRHRYPDVQRKQILLTLLLHPSVNRSALDRPSQKLQTNFLHLKDRDDRNFDRYPRAYFRRHFLNFGLHEGGVPSAEQKHG